MRKIGPCFLFSIILFTDSFGNNPTHHLWESIGRFPSVDFNGSVSTIVSDDDGNIYVGGFFSAAGEVVANNIAKWDGKDWVSLGDGINGEVDAIAIFQGDIYAGGAFSKAGDAESLGIAKWNGSEWLSVGSNFRGLVQSLLVQGDKLFVGGEIDRIGTQNNPFGETVRNIVCWDGEEWSALGEGISFTGGNFFGSRVSSMAWYNGKLFVGGTFTKAGEIEANNIAYWDGTEWFALGDGSNGNIRSLAVSDGSLYVGGTFSEIDGQELHRIASWDGATWSSMGSGLSGGAIAAVFSIAFLGDELFAGGGFTTAGGVEAAGLAKWDGSTWSPLGGGLQFASTSVSPWVEALLFVEDKLLVGGHFDIAGDVSSGPLAKWENNDWAPIQSGSPINEPIRALIEVGGEIIVGGEFQSSDSSGINYVAKWTGNSWEGFASGIDKRPNGFVLDLEHHMGNLYAAGSFRTAGGVDMNSIAKWDGNSWSGLGSGLDDRAFVVEQWRGDIFVGGKFTEAGGISANNIAKWNDTQWSALGTGMDSFVWAIDGNSEGLYVGGEFTSAGGVSVSNIALWDGDQWAPLGLGVNDTVFSIISDGTDIIVGGDFTSAGEIDANHVARWDGESWLNLGEGLDFTVSSLLLHNGILYAVGYNTASVTEAIRAEMWDGEEWSSLNANFNRPISDMIAVDGYLYAGGSFFQNGDSSATGFAKSSIEPVRPEIVSFSLNDQAESTGSRIVVPSFSFAGGNPTAFKVSETSDLSDADWIEFSTPIEFELSLDGGLKTVYFWVKNDAGSSSIISDSILFDPTLANVLDEQDYLNLVYSGNSPFPETATDLQIGFEFDYDQDTVSNGEEWAAGSDPTDINDFFWSMITEGPDGQILFVFSPYKPESKVYKFQKVLQGNGNNEVEDINVSIQALEGQEVGTVTLSEELLNDARALYRVLARPVGE